MQQQICFLLFVVSSEGALYAIMPRDLTILAHFLRTHRSSITTKSINAMMTLVTLITMMTKITRIT